MYCSSNKRLLLLPLLVQILLKAVVVVQVVASEGGGHLFGLDHLPTIQYAVIQHVENERRGTKALHQNDRVLQQESASASITAKGDNEPSSFDIHAMCQVIERSFNEEYNVTCTCAGNVIDNFSIACDYMKPICHSKSSSNTCGIPQIAISMVKQQIFSSTTCIHNYTRNNILQKDTCVFVDTCANTISNTEIDTSSSLSTATASNRELFHPKFCDCTASYGNEICSKCQICPGMNALSVDCSNINAQAISSNTCTEIDLDLHLSASSSDDQGNSSSSSSTMAGFAPDFAGFCTQLENSMNNTISCDCTNAIGGSYNISCITNDRICVHDDDIHCGTVNSTVAVMDGTIHSVTACAAYDTEPFMTASSNSAGSGITCTTMNLCNANDSSSSEYEQICSCSATYEEQSCNSCNVIRRDASTVDPQIMPDTTYVTIDCSNVNKNALTESPQPIYGSNSYEFLPYYSRTIKDDISFDNSKTGTSSSCRYQYSNSFYATLLSTIVPVWMVYIVIITDL